MLLLLHQYKEWINFTGGIGTSIYRVLMGITGPFSAVDNTRVNAQRKHQKMAAEEE